MSHIQLKDNTVDDLSPPSPDGNETEMDTVEENTEPESLSSLIKPEKNDIQVITVNPDLVKTQGDKENEKTGKDKSEKVCSLEEVNVLDPVPFPAISDNSAGKYL